MHLWVEKQHNAMVEGLGEVMRMVAVQVEVGEAAIHYQTCHHQSVQLCMMALIM